MLIALVAFASIESKAQVKTLLSEYGLATDTVTNTGTAALTVQNKGNARTTLVQVNIHKLSGTVAGTLSLRGSLDGTNYYLVTDSTFTATNVADQSFLWLLDGNPALYYQVQHAGSGTMGATIAAKLLSRD